MQASSLIVRTPPTPTNANDACVPPSMPGSPSSTRHPLTLALLLVITALTVPAAAQGDDAPATPSEIPAQPAEKPPPLVPPAFESPVATLRTFIVAMFEEDRDRAVECLDLSLVEEEGAADRAVDLYRAINRIEYIDFENDVSLWDGKAAAIGDRTSWQFFPRPRFLRGERAQHIATVKDLAPDARIVLTRQPSGRWLFSAETVRNSREFYETLRRAGVPIVAEVAGQERLVVWERIEALWPEYFVRGEFLGVKYWQWATLAVLICIGIVIDFTTRFLVSALSIMAIRRRGSTATRETLKRMVRPFGLTAAALFWLVAVRWLGLPDQALRVIIPAVKLFAMLSVVWSAYRVTDLLAEVASNKAAHTHTRFDDLLIPLLRKAFKVLITVFGLIYIADSLDVPIAPLLTGLGIGGAGFAFAAKDTLEHLFGSLTVITDRPFEVGDWIKIDDVEGTVEELGFRSTRVRTFYNSLVTVPNGNLVRAVVDNYGRRKYRRWTTHLAITYDTPPETIEAFCGGIREIVRLHPYTRKDYYQVWLHQLGAHSLDILIYMFFETPDWTTELRERHRFILDTLRLAERLGVEFAFPTQTLHLSRDHPSAAEEPAVPEGDAERRARAIGKRAVRAIVANAPWRTERPVAYEFEYAADDDPDSQVESKVGGSA